MAKGGSSLPWSRRLSLLTDVAEGMRFLHCEAKSIHRDLVRVCVCACVWVCAT